MFSVALSLGSPPVAVSNHPALWSSDFPLGMFIPSGHLVYSSKMHFLMFNIFSQFVF